MKTILQMILAKYRAKIEYIGMDKGKAWYHVTLPATASEDDIYGAREGVANTFGTILYTTEHKGVAHFGVFSEC